MFEWSRDSNERSRIEYSSLPKEIRARLSDAAAVAKAAVLCAEAGSEREAFAIALDLNEPINEARILRGAVCLIGRISRPEHPRPKSSG